MGAKQNLETIEELLDAARSGDWERYGALFDENATLRTAGVPEDLGGVTQGRPDIVAFAQGGAPQFEAKTMFGDDSHVCVISRFSAAGFPGNDFLKGADKPFTTWQAQVYKLENGRIVEATSYINWLDVYVQTGLVDPGSLIR